MNVVGYIALFGYLPVAAALFALLPVRRAIIWAYLIGWLFLPVMAIKFAPGIPAYSKESAIAVGALLGCAIFRPGGLTSWRPSWVDLPMAVYLLSPVISNVFGGEGLYEGLCTSLTQVFRWGIPWLLGRAYFNDLEGARELALGLVWGGLIYAPLCWTEIELSPQLNNWVYGFYQHAFIQTRRMGGWRPMVFMQHGLAVGMWMTCAALAALWLWRAKAVGKVWGMPMGVVAGGLLVTAAMCKSLYALFLLVLGAAVLWGVRTFGVRWVALAVVLAAPAYIALRTTGDLVLKPVVSLVEAGFGFDRASSLETRLKNEQLIVNRALERPVQGWGGNGAYLVRDPGNPDRFLSVPDQFWVITVGQGGGIAIVSLCGVLLLPGWMFFRACPGRDIGLPEVAPVAVLAMVPVLFMLDCLMNAMMNPVFTVASGCVASVTLAARSAAKRQRSVPRLLGMVSDAVVVA